MRTSLASRLRTGSDTFKRAAEVHVTLVSWRIYSCSKSHELLKVMKTRDHQQPCTYKRSTTKAGNIGLQNTKLQTLGFI
jgi:hypothetical protein